MAIAHGSNDIANAAGPLATVALIFETETIPKETPIRLWITAVTTAGLVLGLSTFGYKVMSTLGNRITPLTSSRSFVIQLVASFVTLLSSGFGLPISTTHVVVGCVFGIALVDSGFNVKSLPWRLVAQIVASWIVTIPAAAAFTVTSFILLRLLL